MVPLCARPCYCCAPVAKCHTSAMAALSGACDWQHKRDSSKVGGCYCGAPAVVAKCCCGATKLLLCATHGHSSTKSATIVAKCATVAVAGRDGDAGYLGLSLGTNQQQHSVKSEVHQWTLGYTRCPPHPKALPSTPQPTLGPMWSK